MGNHNPLSPFARKFLGRRRGFAMILTALMMIVVIPIAGLAIDAGIMYAVRARLASASDAAALAAARSLAAGTTMVDQEAAAQARATAFFRANFPEGTLETTNNTVTVSVSETESRVRKVTVTGKASAPVYFMQLFGFPRTLVSAVGEASRRDVNVMLSLDRSGSLNDNGGCIKLDEASRAFVGMFANGRDRVGFVTWGGSYRVDYAPNKYFKQSPSASQELDKLYPGGCNGWTGSAQGLWVAYQQLVAVAEPGALNVIVFFTDGRPNTISADYPVKTLANGGSKSHCWDWEHNLPYTDPAWNPVNQRYRGYIAAGWTYYDAHPAGIQINEAPAMPVAYEPGVVDLPHGYSGTPKALSEDCGFRTKQWSSPADTGWLATNDIPYLPDQDLYGNHLNTNYKTVNLWSGGDYNGRIRPDTYNNRLNASYNAVDHAAQRIRAKTLNSSISVVVYAIGLGNLLGTEEHTLLKRIANTEDSPVRDANAPTGMYIAAPTAAQLNSAFQKIASEVLRLSK
ncbi:MAG: VWA domain-containing protein [Bryobacterales bacterium]|nr:VWA domain-containing protein [Bryobacterales bacterium]